MRYISPMRVEFYNSAKSEHAWRRRSTSILGLVLLSFTLASTSHSASSESKKNISVKEVKAKHASKSLRGYHKKISSGAGSYDLCDNASYTLLNGPSDDIEAERASLGIDCTKKRSTGRYTHISAITGNTYLSDTIKIPSELVEDDISAAINSLHNTMDLGYTGRYFDDMRIQNSPKIIAIKDSLNIANNKLLGLAINNTSMFARDVVIEYKDEEYTVPYLIQPGEVFPFEIPTSRNNISYGQIKIRSSLSDEFGLGRALNISGYGLKGISYETVSNINAEDRFLLGEKFDQLSPSESVVVYAPVLSIRIKDIVANNTSIQPPTQIDDINVVVAFFDQNNKVVHFEQPNLFLSSYNGDDHYYSLSNSLPYDQVSRFAFTNPDSTVDWVDYGIWVGGKE